MESYQVEEKLFSFLKRLGIKTKTFRHPPVFTVEEASAHCGHIPGGHTKNLFVRDKKKNFALITVADHRRVDLKTLSDLTGMGRLSFASADALWQMLGVKPGSVTLFALVNACVPTGAEPPLKFVLDADLMQHTHLNCHPLHNAATTSITPAEALAFIRACGYEPQILDMGRQPAP